MKAKLNLLKWNWGDWHIHWSQKPLAQTILRWNKGFVMVKTLQCWHSYLYLRLHQDSAVRKKSLAAYIHWFKMEAKRCNFRNDAATIRIFIKGLKNAHGLATHIHEKGPETLTDAIAEVEKLNAVQQLAAMTIPPFTVNMISNEENCCFQCQEQGHIAWNCLNIRCFKCGEYGHNVMDCPHMIPLSGTLAIHQQPKPHRSHHTRSRSRHHHEDRDRWSHSTSQSHFHRHCSLSHHNSYRHHSRSWHWDNCSHHRNSSWCSCSTYRCYSHWSSHDTPHWPHHRSSMNRSSSAYHSRDHSRSHSWPSYKSSRQDLHKSHSHSNRSQGKPHRQKKPRVKIEDPHSDYYSSDYHSSDSVEEANHLN